MKTWLTKHWRRLVLGGGGFGFVVILVIAALQLMPSSEDTKPLDLYTGIDQVTCNNARAISNRLTEAKSDAQRIPPDYDKLNELGFPTPVSVEQAEKLQATLKTRHEQISTITDTVAKRTCDITAKTASVTIGGKQVTLPIIVGGDPNNPTVGSTANSNPQTQPVSIGTPAETSQENSWTDLDTAFGKGNDTKWYRDCAKRHLGIEWDKDVPTFKELEAAGNKMRVILAINVSEALTDEEIKQRAAKDNPNVDGLEVIRKKSILNTRHLEKDRCDVFVQTKSEIRVSTSVPELDPKGSFIRPGTTKGILDHCDNFWMDVEATPPGQPGTPQPSTPGTPPPPPVTTPPPPGVVCKPGEVWNGKRCLESKLAAQGPGARNNVPEQAKGYNPPAAKAPEAQPSNPQATYQPPAKSTPPPPRTSVPPPPPKSEVTKPYDPCKENPSSPVCG